MLNFLEKIYFGNSIQSYLIFLGIFIGLFIVFRIFRLVIVKWLEQLSTKTKTDWDDFLIEVVSNITKSFYWFASFYFSTNFLNMGERFHNVLGKIFILFATYEVLSSFGIGVDFLVEKISSRKDKSSKAAYTAIGKALKWFSWLGGILFIFSNFGINITALVTGLGVGGIAVAFALQGVLKDLFSYFTILLDKPVRIGDYIYIGDKKGTVKDIGLKTTRLKAIDGEEVVIANDLITSDSLRNFGKAKERRVNIQYGVSYDTEVKTLKKIKKEIIKIITDFKDIDFKRCHLRNLSNSSMDFDIVYHIKTRDYKLYMDINEDINFKILELFEKEKVEIPFPTQTIYTKKVN